MFTIIGLGEVLWDVFEDGKVLGGAPCNFAYYVNALGHVGLPLSRVGDDELGREILDSLSALGLRTDCVQRDGDHATGRVFVKVDENGVPDFTIIEDVAWDYMAPEEAWVEAAAGADAICFGSLAQRGERSRETVRRVLEAAGDAMVIFDVNFRQHFFTRAVVRDSLARATVLKLNEEEVAQLRQLLGGPGGEKEFLRGLMGQYGLSLACVTRGEKGCTLYAEDQEASLPVPPTEVCDTVGSGDAFTAAMAIKYLEGSGLESIAAAANLMGAYVAGRRGATPSVPQGIVDRFNAL